MCIVITISSLAQLAGRLAIIRRWFEPTMRSNFFYHKTLLAIRIQDCPHSQEKLAVAQLAGHGTVVGVDLRIQTRSVPGVIGSIPVSRTFFT